jgi:hypothetical protein
VGKKTEGQKKCQENWQKEREKMTSTGNGPQFRWRVHASQIVAQTLYQLQNEAAAQGRGDQAFAAFRSIFEHLKTDHTEFGEPLYQLPGMKMQLRTAAVRPLVVDFAGSADRFLVFIKGAKLMSM